MERKKYKVTAEVVATAEIEMEADSVDELYEILDVDYISTYDIKDIDDATILYLKNYKKVIKWPVRSFFYCIIYCKIILRRN